MPQLSKEVDEDVAAHKRVTRSVAAKVAAHHERTMQDAEIPAADVASRSVKEDVAARKRVTRSVAAKRSAQDAFIPAADDSLPTSREEEAARMMTGLWSSTSSTPESSQRSKRTVQRRRNPGRRRFVA